MKLKNKKTGEIADVEIQVNCMLVTYQDGRIEQYYFDSIKDLLEWEDYEEPKEHWAIDCFSPDGELVSQFGGCSERIIGNRKRIGNYFETEEEAENAVEKLKAWKRLRDKGFRFDGWKCTGSISFTFDNYYGDGQPRSASDDLDLLFGGEE